MQISVNLTQVPQDQRTQLLKSLFDLGWTQISLSSQVIDGIAYPRNAVMGWNENCPPQFPDGVKYSIMK